MGEDIFISDGSYESCAAKHTFMVFVIIMQREIRSWRLAHSWRCHGIVAAKFYDFSESFA